MIRLIVFVVAFSAVFAAGSLEARAQDKAACQILEIQASNDGQGIDAPLKPLEGKLKRKPFSSYKRFKLLKKHSHELGLKRTAYLDLVDGGKAILLYRDRTESKGKKPRLRVQVNLDDKDGKRQFDATVQISSGDYAMAGYEQPGDKAYILGLSCKVE